MNTIIHEMFHIFYLSPVLGNYYVDKNLKRIGRNSVYRDTVVRGGINTTLVILPNVTNLVRKYFNCNSI